VGGFGDLAVLGFYPNKQITTGEGGAVLVRTPEHAAKIRRLRNQGRDGQGWLDQHEIGYNYRLSELECALGRVQLRRIVKILDMRRAAAQRYHSLLQSIPQVELPPLALPRRTISWFVYVVRLTSEAARDHAQSHLAERGIATGRYFAPIHLQPAWRFSADVTELRLTEKSLAPRSHSLYLIELLLSNRAKLLRLCAMPSILVRQLQAGEVPTAHLD
jgi:perosamine synthetase